MNITRSIICGAKSIIDSKPIQKEITKAAQKATISSDEFLNEMPNFTKRYTPESNFHKLSDELKSSIIKIKENLWIGLKKDNKLDNYSVHDDLIDDILNFCTDNEIINDLFKNKQEYTSYCKAFNQINKTLKDSTSTIPSGRFHLTSKLLLMFLHNENNFNTFYNSKTFGEITEGKFDIAYLKDIKITDKIDDTFFYNLFDNLEKKTNKRLTDAGLDKNAVNKYLKICDDEICKDAGFTENFIKSLETINNPELANKLLNKFEIDETITPKNLEKLRQLIDETCDNPEIVEKVLKMKNLINPHIMLDIIDMFKDIPNLKINDELYEYYLKLEGKNPQNIDAFTLYAMNDFLKIKGTDEKMLTNFIDGILKYQPESTYNIITDICEANVPYLKNMLEKGQIDQDSIEKFILIKNFPKYKDQSKWENLDIFYNKQYKPIRNFLAKYYKNPIEEPYRAIDLLNIFLKQPKTWQTYRSLGLFTHIKNGKINPRILSRLHKNTVLLPEVINDLQHLTKGESIIKKFNSTKDVLKQTRTGDVICVNEKMYINNNGKLEPWNMTEEKFNELFPLVDRFSTKQGKDDCYLISNLTSLYKNPKTRGIYYKCFEQKGNDIFVTIPAYKNFQGTVKFPNGEIELSQYSADAAKHIQLLERTYERTALRPKNLTGIDENPLTTNNFDKLNLRIRVGYISDVISDFLCDLKAQGKASFRIYTTNYKNILTNIFDAKNYIIAFTTKSKSDNIGHALTLRTYKAKGDKISYSDPNNPAVLQWMSFKEFMKKITDMNITRIK